MRFGKIAAIGAGCLMLGAAGVGSAVAAGQPKAAACSAEGQAWYPSFDGKGDKPDVPVGVPGDRGGAGSVEVRFDGGSPKAVQAPDGKAGDRFGTAVLARYVNDDGCADLLVGAPGRDAGGAADSGSVYVYLGSDDGLVHSKTLELGAGGMPGPVQKGAGLGSSLAAGIDTELVAGLPKFDVGSAVDAGALIEFDLEQGSLYHQDSPGIPGTAETGDNLGAAVTVDGVMKSISGGAPGEDVGSAKDAGGVTQGSRSDGGEDLKWTRINQDTEGVPGHAEAGDRFGAALAPQQIGVPGEDLGSVADAGAVVVDWRIWDNKFYSVSQDSPGISGGAENGDRFGAALAQHNSFAESNGGFSVGAPGEDLGATADAGVVHSIGLRGTEAGLVTTDPGAFSAGSTGDEPTAKAYFGSAVAYYYSDPEQHDGFHVFGAPGTADGKGAVVARDFAGGFHGWVDDGTPETGDAYGESL